MVSKIRCCNGAATHTGFLVYYAAVICWFSMLEILLFVSLLSFYLRRQIEGEWCGFMCCIAAATLWCYLVFHGLNSVVAMLLFTISSAAQKSHFGTGFYGYLTSFSA